MATFNFQNVTRLKHGEVLRDTKIRGLYARGNARGVSYYLRYKNGLGVMRRELVAYAHEANIEEVRALATKKLLDARLDRAGLQAGELEVGRMTMADFAERYFSKRDFKTKAEAKRMWLKDGLPAIGHRRVIEVRRSDLDALHTRLTQQGAPIVANRTIEIINAMLNWAIEREHVEMTNPATRVIMNRENKRERRFDETEFSLLVDYLGKHQDSDPAPCAFLWCMMTTGARPTELLRARLRNLVKSVSGDWILRVPGKNGRTRDIHVPQIAKDAIDRIPRPNYAAEETPLVGMRFTPKRFWNRFRAETGAQDLWMRDLRRTWGSMVMDGGMTIEKISKMLGHTHVAVTQRYLAQTVEENRQAQRVAQDIILSRINAVTKKNIDAQQFMERPA